MASTAPPVSIHLKGLGRQKMTALARKAKQLGLTPARYVRQLVEDDLAIARDARTTPFQQLAGPGRDVDESELDQLVQAAKTAHHRRTTRKKR